MTQPPADASTRPRDPAGEDLPRAATGGPGTGPSAHEGFIRPIPMEEDPQGCFAGDRGVLDPAVRRVLVRLLRSRFLHSVRHRDDWAVLMDNQQVIESRLHDLFIRLVVDADRGLAYKQQIRSDEVEAPILLRDEPYSRAETLVLVYLRTVYQRESTAGESSARVDVEDVEQTVLSYFARADRDTARRQTTIRRALERLAREGLVEEESEGRYLISPLIEIVLSADKLRELDAWLRAQTRAVGDRAPAGAEATTTVVEAAGTGDPAESDDSATDPGRTDPVTHEPAGDAQ